MYIGIIAKLDNMRKLGLIMEIVGFAVTIGIIIWFGFSIDTMFGIGLSGAITGLIGALISIEAKEKENGKENDRGK